MKSYDMEFLRQEYFHLQEAVDKFDDKALTIKAWSVTVSMAGIGGAFAYNASPLLLLSGLSSLLFWITEALWKTFQQCHYPRIHEIERLLTGQEVEHATSPLILTSWSEAWRYWHRLRALMSVLWWPHVFLPHAVVFLGGIITWLANLRFHFIGG